MRRRRFAAGSGKQSSVSRLGKKNYSRRHGLGCCTYNPQRWTRGHTINRTKGKGQVPGSTSDIPLYSTNSSSVESRSSSIISRVVVEGVRNIHRRGNKNRRRPQAVLYELLDTFYHSLYCCTSWYSYLAVSIVLSCYCCCYQ